MGLHSPKCKPTSAMRRYLHRKIEEYISVYIRPGDSVRTIESQAVAAVMTV
jgi:hypothetical protein